MNQMTISKMKTFNLGNVLESSQMKQIKGGFAGGVQCSWTNVSGNVTVTSCSYSEDQCQQLADKVCGSQNLCSNVDCVYK